MAKISFERSGRFFEPPVEFTLDLDTVSSHAAQRMLYLIEDADFFNLPENSDATPAVEEFLYTITVEAGSARHSVHVSEMDIPEALQPLVTELSTVAVFG
ncbi:MAG TPA: protealysin inhibitor emfourin [Anaerolineales bacterium]|nr:protealysin inhibitor emfourin [Anaerolineales bacterium]